MWTLMVLCSVIAVHVVQGYSSCRNNCGYNMGSCSCSSSCQYYGNCCHDYTFYCSRTTEGPAVSPGTPGFTASAAPCGGSLFGSGAFSSPNYPSYYQNNAYCVWQIRATYGQRISLAFTYLQLASCCTCDYLLVYDGPSVSSRYLGKVCSTSWNSFNSTSNYMTVLFRTDSSVVGRGFRAEYRSSLPPTTGYSSCRNNCGYNMGSCSCSSSCQYYGNCCHDYTFYCSRTTEGPAVSPGTTGFTASAAPCGGSLFGSGTFSSPNYPGYYQNHLYCVWQIRATYGQRISLAFTYLQLASCCTCDYLLVYDGPSVSSRYLGKVCSTSWNSFNSTSNYMTVLFTTDSSAVGRGFRAEYRSSLPPTTGYSSCRNNCGYNMGSCSCSSSCQYYGNCCHDYTFYCSRTTEGPAVSPGTPGFTASAAPCGGSLFGSGAFSSPNYPSYYQNNAYCVWQIRATYDQRIYLAFTYLQLENCCTCDYLSVYDGPSVSSRYLGKVCNTTLNSFYSTSNYMTVLFRTDSSVVGRGFRAEFRSSLPPSSGQVNCSSGNMNVVLERSYLNSLGYDGHNMYLNNENCRPRVTRYQVVFNYHLNSCGNIRKFEDGRATYTNAVRAYTSSYGEITRQSHFKLNVVCRMEQDSVSQSMYLVQHIQNSSIIGTGRFNTSMHFYTSSNYYYQVTEVPYKVSLSQNLYVQVSPTVSDGGLALFIDTCVASPSPHDFQTRAYYLVRNGCTVDNTYQVYASGYSHVGRFSFKAFQFLRASDSVYLQCKVLFCDASDYNSRCRRGCMRRMTRGVASEHDSQTLVLGPIQLQDPEENEEGTRKQDEA